jgi:hypothetical protein
MCGVSSAAFLFLAQCFLPDLGQTLSGLSITPVIGASITSSIAYMAFRCIEMQRHFVSKFFVSFWQDHTPETTQARSGLYQKAWVRAV